MKGATFAQRVVDWASVHGRHNLPGKQTAPLIESGYPK